VSAVLAVVAMREASSTADTRASLVSDTRGAVMMTGLFLSFFLVGALWFVLGIGDTIVFRNRMQEAADHAAFTSAALHAKGMNFIAAVNLIMLVLVIVHIVLGLIHDVTLVVCIFTWGTCGAWLGARNVYTKYSSSMKGVLKGLHLVEKAAAYGYPYVGLVKSVKVGDRYGKQHRVGDIDVFAVSPSMVPDFVSQTPRVGLPVTPRPYKVICEKVSDWAFDKVLGSKGYDPNKARSRFDEIVDGALQAIGIDRRSQAEKEIDELGKLLRGVVPARYCNPLANDKETESFRDGVKKANKSIEKKNDEDTKAHNKSGQQGPVLTLPSVNFGKTGDLWSNLDPGFDAFWGENGPLYVDDGAKNGHFFMQVWALNFQPKLKDASETKVKIAARKHDGVIPEEGPIGYFAQAEFYFDCKDEDVSPSQAATWGADQCNGDGPEANASYSLKWRARLRRVAIPEFGKLLGEYLYTLVTTSDPYQKVRNVITSDNVVYDKLTQGPFTGALVEELKKQVEAEVAKAEGNAKSSLIDGLQGAHDSVLDGVYH
jgi:hypothetical protein